MKLMSFPQADKFACERALIIFPWFLFQEAEVMKSMMEVAHVQSPQQESRRKGRRGAGEVARELAVKSHPMSFG